MKNNLPFDSGHLPILLSASRIEGSDNVHPRLMHRHDDFLELLLILEGHGEYIVDGETYAITKGDLVVCDSGVLHDEVVDNNFFDLRYNLALTNIRQPGLPANRLVQKGTSPILHTGPHFDTLRLLFRQIFDHLHQGRGDAQQTAQFMSLAAHRLLLTHFFFSAEETEAFPEVAGEDSDPIRLSHTVRAYLDEHYAENITLDTLASTLAYSKYYLAHQFRRVTGYSVLEYVNRRRIGEAQTLLIATDKTITEIMGQVGFNSLSSFGLAFRKAVGMSPSAYRKVYVGN